jgi:hypothetical protein
MHVVAVDNLGEDREGVARALSDALGIVFYDAFVRVRVPDKGPLLVAAYAEESLALEKAEKLREAGFQALVLGQDDVETDRTRIIVGKFFFRDREMGFEGRTGGPMSIAYDLIKVIIRGIRIIKTTETETVKDRKFDAGRAILTGGLSLTKSVSLRQQNVSEVREGFVHLYPDKQLPIVFLESALQYDSLGPSLQPSRAANFAFLAAELKRRCAGAVYDDRLVNKAAQSRLLGPRFDPEKHLDTAITILSKSLLL